MLAIGLDVGGTKIAGGVVAFPSGALLARRVVPTGPERGGEAVLADVLALAGELAASPAARAGELLGIGVAVAELVDAQGNVTSGQTIDWRDVPVAERFSGLALDPRCRFASSRAGALVVESDVRAAALAEARFGAGRPFSLFVYVTVGTGISSCLVQEGRPFPGARGNALVMASGPWSFTCPACHAQAEMILEEFASGPALVRRYNEQGLTPDAERLTPDGGERQLPRGVASPRTVRSGVRRLPRAADDEPPSARRAGSPSGVRSAASRAEEVLAAAEAGEPAAREVVGSAGFALGNSVAFLVNVLDPEAVIVGGGLGLAGGLYWERFVAATRAHVWAEASRELPILKAALGVDAGVIGAAAAAWQHRPLVPRGAPPRRKEE
jgi:glucokinase